MGCLHTIALEIRAKDAEHLAVGSQNISGLDTQVQIKPYLCKHGESIGSRNSRVSQFNIDPRFMRSLHTLILNQSREAPRGM